MDTTSGNRSYQDPQTTKRQYLCPVCDRAVKRMGAAKGWEWFYCLECEVEFKLPAPGKEAGR